MSAGGFSPRLVMMAREPRAGRVKSRLAASIGPAEALRFYRTTLARVLRSVGGDPRWHTMLAVTPDSATDSPVWPAHVGRLAQGGGDLGERMQRIFNRLPPGPTLIVGSDIPGIRAGHVARAFALLGRHDAVFGPAEDGGYWLIGLRRRPRIPRLFHDVRLSSEHALADTLANCRDLSVGLADTLSDVDTAEDWRAWRRRP